MNLTFIEIRFHEESFPFGKWNKIGFYKNYGWHKHKIFYLVVSKVTIEILSTTKSYVTKLKILNFQYSAYMEFSTIPF